MTSDTTTVKVTVTTTRAPMTTAKTAIATRSVPKKRITWDEFEWNSVARLYRLHMDDADSSLKGVARKRHAVAMAQQPLPENRRRLLKGTGNLYSIVHKLEELLPETHTLVLTPEVLSAAEVNANAVPPGSLRGMVIAAAKASNTGLAGLVEQVAAHKIIQPTPVLPTTPPPVAPISGILRVVIKEEIAAQAVRAEADLLAMEERILAAIAASEKRMMAMWIGDASAPAPVVQNDAISATVSASSSLSFIATEAASPKPKPKPKRVLIVGALPRQVPFFKERLPGVEVVATKEVKAHGHFDLVVGLSNFMSKPMRKAMNDTFGSHGFVEVTGVVTKVCEVISAKLG